MFQEWANRGIHYWQVANNNITLVNGQAVYTMFRSQEMVHLMQQLYMVLMMY